MSSAPAPVAANPYAVFHLPPTPALDEEVLKDQFLKGSAQWHPDKYRQAGADALATAERETSALNEAYAILREPKERLLALYTLETGAKPRDVQRIPPGTMDLFVEVGQLCQKIDVHLASRASAESALAKVQVMTEGLEFQDALEAIAAKLNALAATLQTELTALNEAWIAGTRDTAKLETLYRKFSYLARWRQQLEERQVALVTGE